MSIEALQENRMIKLATKGAEQTMMTHTAPYRAVATAPDLEQVKELAEAEFTKIETMRSPMMGAPVFHVLPDDSTMWTITIYYWGLD